MGLFSRFSKKSSAEKIDDTVDEERDVDDVATEDTEAEESTDIDSDEAEPSDADNSTDDEDAAEDEDVDELDEDALLEKSAPYDRSEKGPFDASEDYPELNRLDLGALKVPVVDGMQVRLDTDDESQRVLAVTLIHEGGGIQLQAFATPRSEGLWNTVRKQLASGVTSQGGEASELHTALGRELAVEVPAKTEDGRPGKRDMRFAGVDGPRWFVRAVFSGKAVTNDEIRSELSALFRGVIVDRGQEAMAPRELIVLTAPEVNGDSETEDEDKDELNPFERGPEITEVR
ncbi:DUF3710 domain-containing protein [Brevibacterium aurantiacum]|uniref:DUF3710 domain-containing protein n=1 Tax=Brevibacterium aurantiacum TaxID=273384 RepID=A0A1D7W4N2_BREAU|nr:DUF3710 domain-containing protein [Brevibacterium aurantiacum]AOP54017.1 hypothetical protein BLSMQ_2311 [Brevibacterium aurantiacum]AZL09670.1 DUF3710 domain-containing protein [Brevibacterium aurantiacum]AZT93801.1 DUF3710 domain-containing protein [Brevibacterium aurantiacum]PCC43442.1 DUF3710 domain-containing protein [Brevibacterium aurantiacum]RCS96657.1 DUF3710 domain-containing protein [Brevibacterium aurantiacum]